MDVPQPHFACDLARPPTTRPLQVGDSLLILDSMPEQKRKARTELLARVRSHLDKHPELGLTVESDRGAHRVVGASEGADPWSATTTPAGML